MIGGDLENIRRRIAAACDRAGRTPDDVTLVAVSKTFPASIIREAVHAGVRDVGENYVQEIVEKRALLIDEPIRWHYVGHLQRNKVRHIAAWIHLIHSVDSVGLASEIDRRAQACGRTIDVLVEVNTTGESSKYGVRPEEAVALVRQLGQFHNITVCGLMTIGPFLPDPEGSRPMFRELRALKERIGKNPQSNVRMQHLSMGMTGDYEVAVEEGSTMVRIGTAIFGSRTGARATPEKEVLE